LYKRISVEGLAVLGVAVVLLATRCGPDPRIAELEQQVEALQAVAERAQLVTDSVTAASNAERIRVSTIAATARRVNYRLRYALDSAEAVLGEVPPETSVYIQRLRASLANVTEQARQLSDSTDVLLGGIADLITAQDAERQAWLAERAATASVVAAQHRVIEQSRCSVLTMPCPTRVQSAIVGAGILLLLIL
jgi:hypothetical protein